MRTPKVLTLDIETSLMTAYIFQVGEQRVNVDQVKEDWYIMCFSAKWLNKPGLIYKETRTKNDKQVVKALRHLLEEADIVITQNGKRFDGPKIEARMQIHRMLPPSPYKHLDTYLVTKPYAHTSHKLSYLTDKLNDTHSKASHSKFPGLSLWIECSKGNKEAWIEMQKYNKKDVLATEELYLNIKPWINASYPSAVVPIEDAVSCVSCHSYKLRSLGIKKTLAGKYRRYICTLCGKCNKGALVQ